MLRKRPCSLRATWELSPTSACDSHTARSDCEITRMRCSCFLRGSAQPLAGIPAVHDQAQDSVLPRAILMSAPHHSTREPRMQIRDLKHAQPCRNIQMRSRRFSFWTNCSQHSIMIAVHEHDSKHILHAAVLSNLPLQPSTPGSLRCICAALRALP